MQNFIVYTFNFNIHYKCNYGEMIFIVGNTEFLGNWNPFNGLKLEWTNVIIFI